MYNTDRPIDNVKNDLLGRASFSKQLSKALYYYSGDDSLVVGLFGKWGSGKTSVINMALQTMDETNYDNEEKPIIVKFAPYLLFLCLKSKEEQKYDLWLRKSKYKRTS